MQVTLAQGPFYEAVKSASQSFCKIRRNFHHIDIGHVKEVTYYFNGKEFMHVELTTIKQVVISNIGDSGTSQRCVIKCLINGNPRLLFGRITKCSGKTLHLTAAVVITGATLTVDDEKEFFGRHE